MLIEERGPLTQDLKARVVFGGKIRVMDYDRKPLGELKATLPPIPPDESEWPNVGAGRT